MLSRNRVDLKPYHKDVTISFEPPKSPSSPFDMPGTNRHTDKTNQITSSHPYSQRPNWFTPEWLTPWVTTTNHHNHHRQSDIATDMIKNYLQAAHLSAHLKLTHHPPHLANTSACHQILSTKRDPLLQARIHHLRPVHETTNLKLNVNRRQNKIQKMYLCQGRPGAARRCACLAGTENEFLCQTWSKYSP